MILKSFQKGFRKFGLLINNVINFVLLLIVYILGIGPISIIGRIFGKEFLDLGKKEKETYWINREAPKEEDHYRMF